MTLKSVLAIPLRRRVKALTSYLCVGNDNDVRDVGTQALAVMKTGSVLVDHTTASADIARELYKSCQDKQVGFLDAPVSGGQAGAENGQLTIMVGGDEDVYSTVEPVMAHYARHSQLLGKSGSGQLAKMMNQSGIAGIVQGLAEAYAGHVLDLIVMRLSMLLAKVQLSLGKWKTEPALCCSFDFGFAVDWMRKDLSIALDGA